MNAGLNRRIKDANPAQSVDALDVDCFNADLQRRYAFNAIGSAAPFILPAGIVTVKTYVYGTGYTTHTGRRLSVNYTNVGSTTRILIGCRERFAGIDWGLATIPSSMPTGKRYLRPRFVLSWSPSASIGGHESDFERCKWFHDSTKYMDSSGDEHSLVRTGRIFWHADSVSDSWTSVTIDGVAAYWVALDFSASPIIADVSTERSIAAGLVGGTTSLSRPGIRCFKLEPVTAIVPLGINTETSRLTISERKSMRGQCRGVQIGAQASDWDDPQPMGVVKDEGAGIIGSVTGYDWVAGSPWAAGGTHSYGTGSRTVVKSDTTYTWQPRDTAAPYYDGQFGGMDLVTDIAPATSITTTAFTCTLSGTRSNEFEDCWMVCTTAGGISQGDRNRIAYQTVSGSSATFVFAEAWGATPTTSARLKIISQPHHVVTSERLSENGVSVQGRFEVRTNDDHNLYVPQNSFAIDPEDTSAFDTPIDDQHISFSVERETRYEIPAGDEWSWTFDTITREFIFSNGRYAILRWDGRRLRELRVASPTDPRVELWTGIIRDLDPEGNTPALEPSSQLYSQVPIGKFVTDFGGRLVVAGIPGDPTRLVYSAPGWNDIWPRAYSVLIRDELNSPITGLHQHRGQLIAATANSLHSSPLPQADSQLSFRPVSVGVGFINQRSVQLIPYQGISVLVGANADGVYMFNGTEPVAILDDWMRLLPDGVNEQAISRCVAGVSYYDTRYMVAVPPAGQSTNTRLLVFDWSRLFWTVYSCPFGGITSIANERDAGGRERILFGHADGTISVMRPNLTDDGETITGRATTAPISLANLTQSVTGVQVTVKDTGAETMQLSTYIDHSPVAKQSYSAAIAADTPRLGTMVLGTDYVGGERLVTRLAPAKYGTRGTIAQLEVAGTGRWVYRGADLLTQPLSQRSKK